MLRYALHTHYANAPEGGYNSMVPKGKTYALIISQGAPDLNQYKRSVRWLAGMTCTGLGMKLVGQIIHTSSDTKPARKNKKVLEKAFQIGQDLVV